MPKQQPVIDTQGATTETSTTALTTAHNYVPTQQKPFTPNYSQSRPVIGIPQAPYAVATGQEGALKQLALQTAGRSALIATGLYLAGVRNAKHLALGSIASSATLSLLLTLHHGYSSGKRIG